MNKSLVNGFMSAALFMQLAGCATTNRTDGLPRQAVTVDPSVTQQVVQMNPCEREGIKLRPAFEVTRGEFRRREDAGEVGYFHAGHYIFAERSVLEKVAPLAGAVIGGALGSEVGHGGARVAATAGGALGGAVVGDMLAKREKLERLAAESGCEDYAEQHPPRRGEGPNPGVDSNTGRRGYDGYGYRRPYSWW